MALFEECFNKQLLSSNYEDAFQCYFVDILDSMHYYIFHFGEYTVCVNISVRPF